MGKKKKTAEKAAESLFEAAEPLKSSPEPKAEPKAPRGDEEGGIELVLTEPPARKKPARRSAKPAVPERKPEVPLPEPAAQKIVEPEEPESVVPEESAPPEISGAADVPESAGASPGVDRIVADVMEGDPEENGALTLARYASHAYLEYAMSVVKSRTLPDVTDGQKPVQRRILIDMARMGLQAGARFVKCARVVGDVLGKYHPHGDQSVYNALVRMAQNFSLRYPLIDGEGNFGSRDGDSQAAMRYTEARLTPIASLLLDEVDQGAVDFIPNYDGNFQEPVELPAKLPFVLLNGSSGIAVGMATDIPSHNLNEVAAAATLLLEKPEATLDEVLAVMPGPDFPCGGQIISSPAQIRAIYRTGNGRLRVRARYHFEELQRGQWQLVVDELPPESSAADVLGRIEEITNPRAKKDKKSLSAKQLQAKSQLLSVLDRVRDESGRNVPVRLVFEPRTRLVNRAEFVRTLFAQTSLESNVKVNLVMLGIDGKPRQKGLLEILSEWIEFRLCAVRRRTQTRLDKVLDQIHVLEGRSIALLNIDRVIEIIRGADDPKAALMAEFGLSERQAEDILEIRLRQLARLEAIKIERDLAKLNAEREGLEKILGSRTVLKRRVVKEIAEAAKTFGDARRTLIEEAETTSLETPVQDDPVTVVVSKKGFLRTRTGHGLDLTNLNYKVGDGFLASFECRSVESLVVLDDRGRAYTIAVSNLPGGRGDGLPVSAFIDLDRGAEIAGYAAGDPKSELLLTATDGMGLLCRLEDMTSRMKAGRSFLKVNEGEKAFAPVIVNGAQKVACLSGSGRLLVFPIEEIRRLPSGGRGVALMARDDGEKLLGARPPGARGVRVFGTGRGEKPRELALTNRSLEDYEARRARKGRQLPVAWRVEGLEAAEAPQAAQIQQEQRTKNNP